MSCEGKCHTYYSQFYLTMRTKKILLYILIGLIVLGTGTYIFLKNYFSLSEVEKKLSKRIERTVEEATNGLYRLSIGKTSVDIDNLSINLQNLHFFIDSTALKQLSAENVPPNTFDILLTKLSINNVDAVKLITSKEIDLHKILLDGITIKMYHIDSSTKNENGDTSKIKISSLYDQLKKNIQSVKIDTLSTHNVSFSFFGTSKKYKQTDVNRMNADLFNILIDSTSGKTKRFLYANETRIMVDSFSMPVSKNRYKLSLERLYLLIKGNTITTIKNLRFIPLFSQEEFARKVGTQVDRFNIQVPEFIIDNFDYTYFLNSRAIVADQILLNNANIDVYNDRTVPPNTKSKVGGYPHQLLSKLELPVRVPYIKVKNASVAYREKNKDTKRIGIISFKNANGDIKNVSNIQGSGVMDITINAKFMNTSPVAVHFIFPDNPKNGEFNVSGKFAAFDGKILNQATVPLGEVNIKSANVKGLQFNISANDTRSNGKIIFYYDGVDVEMLKKDTSSKTGFKKRGFLTFLANKILLRKKNTASDIHPDIISVQYERDVTKSMFNLIWKTIFYGVKEQIGAGGMGKDKDRATVK